MIREMKIESDIRIRQIIGHAVMRSDMSDEEKLHKLSAISNDIYHLNKQLQICRFLNDKKPYCFTLGVKMFIG